MYVYACVHIHINAFIHTCGSKIINYTSQDHLTLPPPPVLTWVGTYNYLDSYTIEDSLLRNAMFLTVGMALLVFSRTFYATAYVYPPDDDLVLPIPTHRSPWYFHLFTIARSLIGVLGQTLVWLGVWNLLEYYLPCTVFREISYACMGMMLFNMTNTFLPNSFVEEDENGDDGFWSWNANDEQKESEEAGVERGYYENETAEKKQGHEQRRHEQTASTTCNATTTSSGPKIEKSYQPVAHIPSTTTGNIQENETGEGDDATDSKHPLLRKLVDFPPPRKEQPLPPPSPLPSSNSMSLAFYARSVLAIAGQVVHCVGVWTLLDIYILPLNLWRNLGCFLGGFLLLVVSGTLMQSAAITPIITTLWQPDDDLTDIKSLRSMARSTRSMDIHVQPSSVSAHHGHHTAVAGVGDKTGLRYRHARDFDSDHDAHSYHPHAPIRSRLFSSKEDRREQEVLGNDIWSQHHGRPRTLSDALVPAHSSSLHADTASIYSHQVRSHPRSRDADTHSILSTMSTTSRLWSSRRARYHPSDSEALEEHRRLSGMGVQGIV